MPAQNIRMSRVSHPRSSVAALVLLMVFFLGFGIVAEAYTEEPTQIQLTEPSVNGTPQLIETSAN